MVSHQPPQTPAINTRGGSAMTRPYLIILAISLALAVCMAAKRKPEQLACAADYYARAVRVVKNLTRQGRGQPPLTCAAYDSVARLP